MLKKSTETPLSNIIRSVTKWKSCRMKSLAAAFLLLLLSCALWAQGVKENIYFEGKMLASVSGEPTWLRFSTTQGFAGTDSTLVTVGNGNGMTIGVIWQFIAWGGNQTPISYETQIGPLTAANGTIAVNGQIAMPIPQDCAPGIITITAIRNIAGGDWIQLSQPAQYTVRPPKPALTTFVRPSVLQLPAKKKTQWLHSANMKNQSLSLSMTLPQGQGAVNYVMPLDNGGDWYSGKLHCSIVSGDYNFISARYALDSNPDAVVLWGAITQDPATETVVPCGHTGGDDEGDD
jgi:hypothetical protein